MLCVTCCVIMCHVALCCVVICCVTYKLYVMRYVLLYVIYVKCFVLCYRLNVLCVMYYIVFVIYGMCYMVCVLCWVICYATSYVLCYAMCTCGKNLKGFFQVKKMWVVGCDAVDDTFTPFFCFSSESGCAFINWGTAAEIQTWLKLISESCFFFLFSAMKHSLCILSVCLSASDIAHFPGELECFFLLWCFGSMEAQTSR